MTDSRSGIGGIDDEVGDEPIEDSRETCFFWEAAKGKCHFEPLILGSEPCADCPDEMANPADGQDCQAAHCPPSATRDCDWPRCAELPPERLLKG